MEVKTIAGMTKPVTVPFPVPNPDPEAEEGNTVDEVVHVEYRPRALTWEMQAKLLDVMAHADKPTREDIVLQAELSCELIASWDLTEDGVPIPIEPTRVMTIPSTVMIGITQAIFADMSSGGKGNGARSGGSFSKAKR